MEPASDVLVLGGGVIGLTTAFFLGREGVRVQVIDQGDFGHEASWAGAGILSPGNPEFARAPIDRLHAHSVSLFPVLSTELRDRTGVDNGYVRCGGLEFMIEGHAAEANEWRAEGITFERIEENDLRRLEPGMAAGLGTAFHLPAMAQVRNPRHIKALLAGCRSYGVGLISTCQARSFELQKEQVKAIATDRGRISAGRYVVTAGAWTDGLLAQTGWRPGICPVRGQIALLNTSPALIRHILLWGSRYIVPRPDGRILIGSTEEHAGFDRRTTAGAIADLLALGCKLVPSLAQAPVERCWAGLRPGSPDGLPFLGRVPGIDNLFVAAGHFRSGIQLSVGTALVMKELLLGQPLTVSLDAFRLDRPLLPRRPNFC